MQSPPSECNYLAGGDTCRAVKESNVGELRLGACSNETKDSCCYLCSIQDCEIRCDLLAEQKSRRNTKGSDPASTAGVLDSPRECGSCIYYLDPECPRVYSRDMELWRRQAPCEIFQSVGGGRVLPHKKTRESSKFGRLQEQLREYREELDKAYGNHERLERTLKELQEETKDKDETILDLKKQLKIQKAKRRGATTKQNAQRSKPVPLGQQVLDKDQTVYQYIVKHGGTISIGKAAQELHIPVENLRNTIERLKKAGTIAQG